MTFYNSAHGETIPRNMIGSLSAFDFQNDFQTLFEFHFQTVEFQCKSPKELNRARLSKSFETQMKLDLAFCCKSLKELRNSHLSFTFKRVSPKGDTDTHL